MLFAAAHESGLSELGWINGRTVTIVYRWAERRPNADHKQLRSGTLRRIIADAGLTVDQFIQLLGR